MAVSVWHRGTINKEDHLFRSARPQCAELERLVADAVKHHEPGRSISVLELGTGTGFSAAAILRRRSSLRLTALDNDAVMLGQGRRNLRAWAGKTTFVRADALAYLKSRPTASFDAVATKFFMHNLERRYRAKLLREVHRVLKPGGLFANADKYALEGRAQTSVLREQMVRYLDVFLPIGQFDLMKHIVAHYMRDEEESHVMRERQAVKDMRRLGFRAIKRLFRGGMDAVYVARK